MESDMVQREIEKPKERPSLQRMVMDAIHDKGYGRVRDVITILQELDASLTFEEIRNAIIQLRDENKVILSEAHLKVGFMKYVMNISVNESLWLVVFAIVGALATMFLIPQVMPWSMIRFIAGGTFLLFIPGYCLVRFLFSKKEMDVVERVALSIGLSFAVVPLIGLLLSFTPLGIRLDPLIASLSAFSITLVVVSTYRRFLQLKQGRVNSPVTI